jgi:hypothetical protein
MINSLLNATVGLSTTLQFQYYIEGLVTYRTTIGSLDDYKGIVHYEIDFIHPQKDTAGLIFWGYDNLSGLIPSQQNAASYISDYEVFEVREYYYDGLDPVIKRIYYKPDEDAQSN